MIVFFVRRETRERFGEGLCKVGERRVCHDPTLAQNGLVYLARLQFSKTLQSHEVGDAPTEAFADGSAHSPRVVMQCGNVVERFHDMERVCHLLYI